MPIVLRSKKLDAFHVGGPDEFSVESCRSNRDIGSGMTFLQPPAEGYGPGRDGGRRLLKARQSSLLVTNNQNRFTGDFGRVK